VTEELKIGDPRFLEKIVQTIAQECKILDLYPKEPLEIGFDGKKHLSVAVILNTGGESLEQLSYFPTRGQFTEPEISPPPRFQLNGKGE